MPLYEYECLKCGNIDEHLMKVSDPRPSGCTACGGEVSKKVSQTSFALKGDGWYVTDYKPKAGKAGGEGAARVSETTTAEASTPSTSAASEGSTSASGSSPATGTAASDKPAATATPSK
jgi:putative FmdB family regulatory protein